MDNLQEISKSLLKRKERGKRRRKVLELVEKILKGEFRIDTDMIDKMFNFHYNSNRNPYHGPRKEYISPEDRSEYNYGYMTIDEMQAGTPNIW